MKKKILDEMNKQINEELYSSYLYLDMATYFYEQNLEGMAHWMRCQAHEEVVHAMKIFHHIVERNGKVTLMPIKLDKKIWKSPLEVWKASYKHELHISSKIHDLMKIAMDESDFMEIPLLQWFETEQIEEEAQTLKAVWIMEKIGDSNQGLILADVEFHKRVTPSGSPLA